MTKQNQIQTSNDKRTKQTQRPKEHSPVMINSDGKSVIKTPVTPTNQPYQTKPNQAKPNQTEPIPPEFTGSCHRLTETTQRNRSVRCRQCRQSALQQFWSWTGRRRKTKETEAEKPSTQRMSSTSTTQIILIMTQASPSPHRIIQIPQRSTSSNDFKHHHP